MCCWKPQITFERSGKSYCDFQQQETESTGNTKKNEKGDRSLPEIS